jgi:hypothetical protein
MSPSSDEYNKGRGPTLLDPLEKASLFHFFAESFPLLLIYLRFLPISLFDGD